MVRKDLQDLLVSKDYREEMEPRSDHRIQYLSLSSVIIDGRNALFFGFSPRLTKIIARIHGVQKIYIINIWGQKQTNVIYLELCVRTRITY